MVNKLFLALALTFIPASRLSAQHQWTLDECVQYAAEHNIDIRQRMVDIQMRETDRSDADSEWMPGVTLNAAQQFSFGNALGATGTMQASAEPFNADLSYTNGAVSVEMPVFNGFRTKNKKQAVRYSLDKMTAQLAHARKNLSVQIAVYYLQALYERGMMQVAADQVATSRKLCERAATLVDEGRCPQSDRADAEAQLAADEYELTACQGKVKMALLNLAQLLNLETAEGFDIADISSSADEPGPLSDGASVDVDRYPSIVAARAQIAQSQYDVNTARSYLWPELTLRATVSTYYLNFFHGPSSGRGVFRSLWDNRNELVGLHLTMPLFDRYKTRNNIRRAELSLVKSQLSLDDARQQLRKEVDQAYCNALTARDRLAASQKSVQASSIAFDYENSKYEAGRSSVYDLAQARQRLRQASEQAVQAKYEYAIRKKILETYQTTE